MLNRETDMRVEAAILAAEGRQLKTEHRRARNYTRKLVSKQEAKKARLTAVNRDAIYRERVAVKGEARLLHLARMLLKGKDYDQVEQYTHRRVDAAALYDTVWQWEPQVSDDYVTEWLGQEAS